MKPTDRLKAAMEQLKDDFERSTANLGVYSVSRNLIFSVSKVLALYDEAVSEGEKNQPWRVSDEALARRLGPRPRCLDCGLESLTGNVHEPDCIQMKEPE